MKNGRYSVYKKRAHKLRTSGKTFAEIQRKLKVPIPKSTLSLWCKNTPLAPQQLNRIGIRIRDGGETGRRISMVNRKIKREAYLNEIVNKNAWLQGYVFQGAEISKSVLTTLYLAEGSKTRRGVLTFGNSDPGIVALFIKLMQCVYKIDVSKYRCTLQCRADQDTPHLERFWSYLTGIPLHQFYSPRIDSRSIGKPTSKKEYKGVCRIDYLSAHVYNDLVIAGKTITNTCEGPIVKQ